jgi:hypothetical protein
MRVEDWQERLWAYIDVAKGQPFVWGQRDCATWVADWRHAVTGQDAARAWRGRYKTERGALRAIRRAGFSDMADWVDSIAGGRLPSPLLAQRGDVAMVQGALGIVVGSRVAALSPQGVVMLPLSDAVAAWRVD